MTSSAPAIRAFLSYSHADDSEFAVVDALVSKLKAFVRAKSGRELEVFVDRESIGWGENWRSKISGSVESATVFIPLLSANYLSSEPCREEFLAFNAKAEVLGVTELLLPILLFRSPLFSEESTDEVAQIAEALQYKPIEDALLAGYQSPEWLQCTRDLAESLLAVLAKAEASLLAAVPETSSSAPAPSASDESTDPPIHGLAELIERLEAAVERMTAAAERLTPAIETLGEVPGKVGDLPESPLPRQVTAWTLRLAQEFKLPAVELEQSGRELFEATKECDTVLLQLRELADSVDQSEMSAMITDGRRDLIENFGDLQEIADAMDGLLASMKPAEVLSVPLRKAIQPARRGLTAVRDSVQLISSWRLEFDS